MLERVMGIEPTSSAWKAEVLPLNYTRPKSIRFLIGFVRLPSCWFLFPVLVAMPTGGHLVEGGGFEPPKAEPTDLQSAPFDHSGTPPLMENA